jgi:hypothetical protein
MSSTKNVTPKGKSAGARGQAVPKTPVKKQKVECHEERTEVSTMRLSLHSEFSFHIPVSTSCSFIISTAHN